MSRLELKVPPDIAAVAVAALMWLAPRLGPALTLPRTPSILAAVALAALGVALVVAARIELDRGRTTWHPTDPSRTSSLVTSGVYRFSRNPIYLGMFLVLVAWGLVLRSPLAVLVSIAFPLYMGRFQIRPEERALSALLPEPYARYAADVRRWL